ncbi:MAG: hypothetical protein ACK5JF_07805 [Oscillospiraceae bacterium]
MIKGKRNKALVAIALVLCGLLAGCVKQNPSSGQKNGNVLYNKSLSQEQVQVVNAALASGMNMAFFSYKNQQQFTKLSVWIETYQNGNLLQQGETLEVQVAETLPEHFLQSGDIVVTTMQTNQTQWQIGLQVQNTAGSFTILKPDNSEEMLCGYSTAIGDEAAITKDGEIILYYILYAKDTLRTLDPQKAVEEPYQVLQQYDYAVLVKAKFSE